MQDHFNKWFLKSYVDLKKVKTSLYISYSFQNIITTDNIEDSIA